jgi:hypothetical protein
MKLALSSLAKVQLKTFVAARLRRLTARGAALDY